MDTLLTHMLPTLAALIIPAIQVITAIRIITVALGSAIGAVGVGATIRIAATMVTAATGIEAVMVMDTVAATAMVGDLQRAVVAEHEVAAGDEAAVVAVNRNSLFRIDTEGLHLPVKVAAFKAEQL